jgi:hypothetical protein
MREVQYQPFEETAAAFLSSQTDSPVQSRSIRLSIVAAVVCILAPILVAYAMLFRLASDVPVLDDYHAILGFSLGWERSPSLESKVSYLASYQHVDYKLIFQESIVAAELGLTHHVNFRFLVLLGNLFLLAILWLLWKLYPADDLDTSERLIRFIPIVCIFFGVNYAETLDFAMESLQWLPAILFSLAAIQLLVSSFESSTRSHYFWYALASAMLACSASANAFLLAPVGLIALVSRREYLKWAVWGAAFIPAALIYRYRYIRFPHPAGLHSHINPVFLISLLGNGAPAYRLAIPMGLFILGVYVYSVWTRYDRQNPAAFLWATWLMLNAILVTIGRSSYGLDWSFLSRYRIYSDLLLVFSYGVAVQRLSSAAMSVKWKKQIYLAVLLASVVFCLRADLLGWRILAERHQKLVIGLEQYRDSSHLKSPMYLADPASDNGSQEEARILTNESVANGIYVLPKAAADSANDVR